LFFEIDSNFAWAGLELMIFLLGLQVCTTTPSFGQEFWFIPVSLILSALRFS
jgi:hypothetical protein